MTVNQFRICFVASLVAFVYCEWTLLAYFATLMFVGVASGDLPRPENQ